MLTIELIQNDDKFTVRLSNGWEHGPRSFKTIQRRTLKVLDEINAEQKWEVEKERRQNAPKKTCPRCQGRGYLDVFLHVARGVCFKCGGSGEIEK